MYNAKYIIPGIILFLALMLSPFFLGKGKAYKVDVQLPVNQTECVESKEVMRTSHMQMLNSWRDRVVRDGERLYTNSKGKQYVMSLTNGCMSCHEDKEKFCDKCHNTISVSPYCWNCHITSPKGEKK